MKLGKVVINGRSKTQVLRVKKDSKGNHYWDSDVIGWIPQERIEMEAKAFSVGTNITVVYSRETVAKEST
jgi:hypothetical protein